MKQIILQRMRLVNFKGIRELEISFDPSQTYICGDNGTGKTSVFDAFCWCLFGKDSTNRSDSNFNVKTLDENGEPILKLEHSVTCDLLIDGNVTSLQRKYCEVWTKPRGTTEEALTSHKTEFYINGVKLSTKKDFDAEINAIISEDVFKMLTNPSYFISLKPEGQKEMLLDMAGSVSDSEVAATKPEFAELLSALQGRALVTFLKEIAARKRAIKDELATIPAQIETAKKLKPEEENWTELDSELKAKKLRVSEIDNQIADKSQVEAAEAQRKLGIQTAIGNKQLELSKRQSAIRTQAGEATTKAQMEVRELEYKVSSIKREIARMEQDYTSTKNRLDALNVRITDKRNEYMEEYNRQLVFPEGAFTCPTCKRPLEPEDIEAKQRELEANFNRDKSSRLMAIQEEGKRLKQDAERLNAALAATLDERNKSVAELEELEASVTLKKESIPAAPDVAKLIAGDAECIRLTNEITDLQNQLTQEAKAVDLSDLKDAKAVLAGNIDELIKRLAKRDQILRADKEIAELEEKRVAANQTLAELEGQEFVATEFQKTKDATLLERMNGLFNLVSFSFVDSQLNGGEKLTCICTVNGVPYPDVNNAGKINAGLDIINAICKSKGIVAPIFIDNREGVNELMPTLSQVINLCVSSDNQLVIK